MDLFAGVLPFVYTAEERSFRRAAARLGVSAAAVSKAVAKLEADLGVVLLYRTSRHVSLTDEGALFLARCREAVVQLQAGRELVAEAQRAPHGPLRASIPPIFGRLLVPAVARLAARHPRLSLHLSFTDRMSRMAEEGIDVALRMGPLPDSSLVARALRTPRWVTLASPAYLARHGTPEHPSDLARHACIKFVTPRGVPAEWSFRAARQGPAAPFEAPSRLHLDQGELLLEAAAAHAGLCQVLDFMVGPYVQEGRLVEVLEAHAADGPPLHAVCLPRRQGSPKVRAFVEMLEEVLGAPSARRRRAPLNPG
jgi:LysR family transcriptional regulator for bpeEF and oprC